MLQRVEIKCFKSLHEVSIDLGLVNVFVGANGSGKSNLLEAIGVLGSAASGRVDDEGLLRRGVRPGVPALYKSSFAGERMRNAIRFGAFAEEASYEIELNNPTGAPRPVWNFKTERLMAGGEKLVGRSPASYEYRAMDPEAGLAALELVRHHVMSPVNRLMRALREYAIYSPNTAALRGLVTDPQSREPVGLAGGRLAEAVEELRRLARKDGPYEDVVEDVLGLMDWVQAFGAKQSGEVPLSSTVATQQRVLFFRDRFMADGRNELSGYDASEGALYVLFAAVVATHPRSPLVLAIDNVDAALNPLLVRGLMERLCSWVIAGGQRQLLMTCHNPMVLDGLPLQDDRVRLFAVDRSNRGKTVVRRVTVTPELLVKAREGWPLSRLWVSGHLGGVPRV